MQIKKQVETLIQAHADADEFRVLRSDLPGDMDSIISFACGLGWGCYLRTVDGVEYIVFTTADTIIF